MLLLSLSSLLFSSLLFLGPVVSISSRRWIVCWAGVELRFLGFIPLIFFNNKYLSTRKESTIKYFCVQSLGRALILYSGIIVFFNLRESFNYILFILSIFIKLGIFPIHFWVPRVVAGIDYLSLFFLIRIQKVAPLTFLNIIFSNGYNDFYVGFGILRGLSSLIGAILGNNQTNIRSILGCSSIAHRGWLILGCMTSYLWGYFSIYCLTLLVSLFLLLNFNSRVVAGMGILSLRGIPPFPIFIGKWGVLKSSLECNFPFWLISFFLVSSVLSLIFYLKFSYSFILNNLLFGWSKHYSYVSVFFLLVSSFLLRLFWLI